MCMSMSNPLSYCSELECAGFCGLVRFILRSVLGCFCLELEFSPSFHLFGVGVDLFEKWNM